MDPISPSLSRPLLLLPPFTEGYWQDWQLIQVQRLACKLPSAEIFAEFLGQNRSKHDKRSSTRHQKTASQATVDRPRPQNAACDKYSRLKRSVRESVAL